MVMMMVWLHAHNTVWEFLTDTSGTRELQVDNILRHTEHLAEQLSTVPPQYP